MGLDPRFQISHASPKKRSKSVSMPVWSKTYCEEMVTLHVRKKLLNKISPDGKHCPIKILIAMINKSKQMVYKQLKQAIVRLIKFQMLIRGQFKARRQFLQTVLWQNRLSHQTSNHILLLTIASYQVIITTETFNKSRYLFSNIFLQYNELMINFH